MLDILVRNAVLPAGGEPVNVAVRDGRIVEVSPAVDGAAALILDAAGRLLSPPFVDAHFHMDATLSLGQRRNRSGTLLEGIRIWGEMKPDLTRQAVMDRALRYCDLAVAQGLLAIRSHVDVCDARLLAAEALLEVRKRVAPYLDLQLVAFPQDGYFRAPGAETQLARALDLGLDVVGGIPHYERTAEDGRRSVRILCALAAERGLRVDMHCDETDDPNSRHVETLAAETATSGLEGRVAASHVTSMHSMDNAYAGRLMDLIAEAELAVIANPLINITLQGRFDTYPKRRGLTRVPELLARGVPVAFGHDCVQDPWYGLGNGDMLDVAHMGLHVAQMTGRDQIAQCFDAITRTPARILGLQGYGVETGCRADFVLLDAGDPIEAIRLRAPRLAVVRRGRLIAHRDETPVRLDLPGRPQSLRFSRSAGGPSYLSIPNV